jgi:MFS transporter, ACS family, tartrate transporter
METVNEQALIRRLTRRIVPFLVIVYLVAIIDRLNVGFAALTMNRNLGLSPSVFGAGAGIFFLGYFLFEVPSNLLLARFGARRWIARIMLTWGIVAVGMAFVQGATSFYIVRFVLGVAEAGFFPGVLLYLTYWFPSQYRARVIGLFMISSPLSNAIAAPVSGLILGMGHFGGLEAWRWLFILEGAPSILLAFLTLRLLTDRPANATWLTPAEKQWLDKRLTREAAERTDTQRMGLWDTMRHPKILIMALIYTGLAVGLYGVALWLPQIVQSLGVRSTIAIGLIVALPFLVATVAMVLWSRNSDRTDERIWHVAAPLLLGAVALVASSTLSNPFLAMLALTVAAVGIYSAQPTFWALPSGYLTGVAAAAGLAYINSLANLAGFFSPFLVGWLRQATGGFHVPLLFLAICLAVGGLATFALRQRHFARNTVGAS